MCAQAETTKADQYHSILKTTAFSDAQGLFSVKSTNKKETQL